MAGDRGRLLTDENFPEPVSRELRSLGYLIDGIRRYGSEKGASHLDDQMVQQIARNNRQIILTQDKDFRDSVNRIAGHHGIIWCKATGDFRELARKNDRFLKQHKRSMKCRSVKVSADAPPYFADEISPG